MSSTPTPTPIGGVRELAHRHALGIDVRLMWHPKDDRLTVVVQSTADGSEVVVDVGDRPPLQVYRHPYRYAAPGEQETTPTAA